MLIVIDGIDGSGKTTQVKLLSDFLHRNTNRNIITTREPGGSKLAERIREILFSLSIDDSLTEWLLYITARRDHFLKIIRPSLDDNKLIICDRFIHSTIAYQGYGFGINRKVIDKMNAILIDNRYPDITFILDADIKTTIDRASNSTHKPGTYEKRFYNQQDNIFYEKVKSGFRVQAAQDNSVFLINANDKLETIHDQITMILQTEHRSLFK